ncbi:MAG TPA: glycoside hydrolase family 38 C-terminal domain-containing protein [Anaerolineaceae bacterium]|nr:glycoside hydrolase family 38 C-terminal domain-containing protein [Anaerolineaceae bacterium]
MNTIHIVSHTHWDREWYLPFEQFRLRLVHLIDNLFAILENEPDYRYFMLDGQAIVLEDYLAMRPDMAEPIRQAVQSGRLLIGPWYILPDEFLVSPEATVRNLLHGERATRPFGGRMMVGYLPDPFGHIGQMPQILRGFGIEAAVLRRGLDDEPGELWWQAPDGSQVFLAYLHDGYGNAAHLPAGLPGAFTAEVGRLCGRLRPHLQTSQVLLMYGTDHMEPAPGTGRAIAHAAKTLEDRVVHSTLPAYLQSVQQEIAEQGIAIPTVRGELRSSKRHDLLPGVLSTRPDVKQRNHACENLLERWAEPSSAWVHWLVGGGSAYQATGQLRRPVSLLDHAWKQLLACHPHDSICGCSVDPVYADVHNRFQAVEQIGETLARQNLETIAGHVDTLSGAPDRSRAALVVFNPSPNPQTGIVEADFTPRAGLRRFELVDAENAVVPAEIELDGGQDLTTVEMNREELRNSLGMFVEGRVVNMSVVDAELRELGAVVEIELLLTQFKEPNPAVAQQTVARLEQLMTDPAVEKFVVHARTSPAAHVRFQASAVPALGWQSYWLRPAGESPTFQTATRPDVAIENEFLRVQVDPVEGSLTVTDKANGQTYTGLNRFVDGGDRGDTYNYCPPERDRLVSARLEAAERTESPLESSLTLRLSMDLPLGLSPDRDGRADQTARAALITRVRLQAGVGRIDIETIVQQVCDDHRLRVHFPAPFAVQSARYDGHFDVIERSLGVPAHDSTWQEAPRPEVPQRLFTDVSAGSAGLMVANQGLPEVEVRINAANQAEIALTLLRCTGWLAREDLANRKSLAGPPYETPGAQMHGRTSFRYAVLPHAGDWRAAAPLAFAFDLPLRAAAALLHPGLLPAQGSLFAVDQPDFVVTAVKIAADGQGIVLRGYNRTEAALEVGVRPALPYHTARRARLDETPLQALAPDAEGRVVFAAGGKEIVTLRFD